jgi:hypothetical protein
VGRPDLLSASLAALTGTRRVSPLLTTVDHTTTFSVNAFSFSYTLLPEYVQRYATKQAAGAATDVNEEEEEEMSEVGSISDREE